MLSESLQHSPRLLLVSQRGTELWRLSKTLAESGFRVEECIGRNPFLLAIENRTCDLALIDATSPETLAWCAALPRSSRGSLVPLVALTDKDRIEEALRSGVCDVIAGDEAPALLAHRLHSALRGNEISSELSVERTALDRTQALTRTGSFEYFLEDERLVCSTESCRILGLEADHPGHWSVDEIVLQVAEDARGTLRNWFARAASSQRVEPLECALLPHARGASRARFVSAGSERRSGCLPRISGLLQDTSEVSPMPLAQASARPALSGLLDNRGFLERVGRMIAGAQSPQDQVAVLYLHVDLERAMYHAPQIAPLIVSTIVQRLRDCIRDRDTLASTGARGQDISLGQVGDAEFGILLPGLVRIHDAYKVARRIQESLAQPIANGSEGLRLDNSLGIALSPHDSTHPEALIQSAASAEKQARAEDKSSIRFFTPSMNASAFERLTLESSLRRAIERRELCLHYQPKVEIATGKIVGFEALARWNHPELGLVSPGQFIPIAEETGLIIPLGEYVLREALTESRRWQDSGLPPVRMAVNLSGVQFRDPHLAAVVSEALDSSGISPEMLELELTESILLQKADAILSKLAHLKKMGVHLSIDDFGTGYSSLSYLKRFPIDSLKIDQSFIREVTTNPEDAAITTSIILMGKSLKLRVVAEGVETQSQLALLRVLECDEVQGYLFGRPVPAKEAQALFARGVATTVA